MRPVPVPVPVSMDRRLLGRLTLGLLARMGAGRSTLNYVNLPGWCPIETA